MWIDDKPCFGYNTHPASCWVQYGSFFGRFTAPADRALEHLQTGRKAFPPPGSFQQTWHWGTGSLDLSPNPLVNRHFANSNSPNGGHSPFSDTLILLYYIILCYVILYYIILYYCIAITKHDYNITNEKMISPSFHLLQQFPADWTKKPGWNRPRAPVVSRTDSGPRWSKKLWWVVAGWCYVLWNFGFYQEKHGKTVDLTWFV